jgi:hypothetical protein
VVTRVSSPTGARTIIFDRQVTGAVASTLYAQLVAGQPIPPNVPSSCPSIPLAPYYHYDLTFSHAGIQTGVAHSDAIGCQTLELDTLGGGQDYYSWRDSNGVSFWETLHHLVDAPVPI